MNIHNAVNRALEVLEYLASRKQPATLTEICQHLDAPKTSMNPIIYTLLARKFIIYDPASHTYALGSALYKIGNEYLEKFDILKYVRRVMDDIVSICSETCYFATLDGPNVNYLLKADSTEKIRMVSSIGTTFPAYATALGKCMLIQYSIDEIEQLYPEGLKPLTPKTITNFNVLMKELSDVKHKGFACDDEESYLDVQCRAVPICRNGAVIASLSISTPAFRFTSWKEELILKTLLQKKSVIEQTLNDSQVDLSVLL